MIRIGSEITPDRCDQNITFYAMTERRLAMNINSVGHTLTLLNRVFDVHHSVIPITDTPVEKPACVIAPIEQPFERATPESQGISSAMLRDFVLAIKNDRTLHMHDMMILRGGKVIFEAAFGDQNMLVPKYTFSACKSVTSLAVGMLIDDGKLSVDDKIVSVFDKQVSPIARLKLGALRIEDVLTMRSGIVFNEAEAMTDTDWLKCYLNSAVTGEIGKTFRYNSLNTYLLSSIVRKVSGRSMTGFLRERLYEPLGIGSYFWETCPQGTEKGGWGLYIRPEDFAKIGQLVLQNGIWQGRRLISEEYLRRATEAHAKAPEEYGDFDYGYQIWRSRRHDWFLFNGMLSQNVLGMRDSGILIVTNAGNDEMFQQGNYFKLVERYFGGLRPTEALPPAHTAEAQLEALRRSLVPHKKAEAVHHRFFFFHRNRQEPPYPSECVNIWSGKSFLPDSDIASHIGLMPMLLQMISNRYTGGLKKIGFLCENGKFILHFCEQDEEYRLPVGFEVPEVSEISFRKAPYRIAVSGQCAVDEEERPVLKLRISYQETPCTRLIKFRLTDDRRLIAEFDETPGMGFAEDMVHDTKSNLADYPIIGGAVTKVDNDYLMYKLKATMQPTLLLRSSAES